MIVVGVDPSVTCSGVAVVEFEPLAEGCRPIEWQTWRGHWRGDTPRSVEEERRRIRFQVREVLTLLPARVDLAVIEGPALRAKFAGKADERSGLRWLLIDQLLARGPVVVVDPRKRALLATGNGGASKADVKASMRRQFPNVHVPDDNVADAVALAQAGAAQFGFPVSYGAKQVSAHAGIAWPVESELLLADGKGK